MRKEAGVTKLGPNKGVHNMRSVRCYKATRWVQICAEYAVMGWDMPPLNPLQHTTPWLARHTYAEPGADDVNMARLRCANKYPEEAKALFAKKGINVAGTATESKTN